MVRINPILHELCSLILRLHGLYLDSCKTLPVKLNQVPQELCRSAISHDFRSSAISQDLRGSAISKDFRSCAISQDLQSSAISQHLRSSSAISQDLCNLAKVDFLYKQPGFLSKGYI